jgi:hypothetical protein
VQIPSFFLILDAIENLGPEAEEFLLPYIFFCSIGKGKKI